MNEVPGDTGLLAENISTTLPPPPKPKIHRLYFIFLTPILILLIIIVALIFKKSSLILGPKISVNFLLRPDAQAEPLVYANGKWETLPRSQTNLYISQNHLLAVCGNGGAYIFDPSQNKITYFFKQDWYPCNTITRSKPDHIEFTDHKGTATVNLTGKNVVKRDESYVPPYTTTPLWNTNHDYQLACDNDTCARLQPGGHISISKQSQTISQFTISDAIALVGLRGNFLFYAVNVSYGYQQNIFDIITPAHAFVINHKLCVYFIDQKKSSKLLDSFRYDYQEMIFLDRVSNSALSTQLSGSNANQWDNITPGVKNSSSYPELDNYQRKKYPSHILVNRKTIDPVTPYDHILGNPNADTSLILQCSLESTRCKDFAMNNLAAFLDHYQDRIKVVYRHHVSGGVPRDLSQEAAEFSECVAKISGENKFWDFIKLYFTQTDSLGYGIDIKYMPNIVSRIGGDTDKTVKCFLNGETTDKVLHEDENSVVLGCESILAWKDGYFPNVCGYDISNLNNLITNLDKQISLHNQNKQ